MLPTAIVLHNLSPYLTLYDVIVYIALCKQTNTLSSKLLHSVKYVEVKTNIERFMRRLTKKCPNITKLRICDANLTDAIITEVNKLPLTSLEFPGCERFSDQIMFNLPRLTSIYVSNAGDFDLIEPKNITSVHVQEFDSGDAECLREFKNLKEVLIDRANDTRMSLISKLPIRKINISANGIRHLKNAELESLSISMGDGTSGHEIMAKLHKLNLDKLRELEIPDIDEVDEFIRDIPLHKLALKGYKTESAVTSASRLINKSIKELSLNGTFAKFSYLKLPNLDKLELINCEVTPDAKLPIRYLSLCGCELWNLDMQLLSLHLEHIACPTNMKLLPTSLVTLIIKNVNGIYDEFPSLPKLTTLQLSTSCNCKEFDGEDSESDDEVGKTIEISIQDEVWHRIAKSPIQDLHIESKSLNDTNIHYFAETPINYLDIENTEVTIVGLASLKKLPLRKLVTPNIPLHQVFQV